MSPSCRNGALAHRFGRRPLFAALLALISGSGLAHQEEEYMEEVLVEGRRIDLINRARTASSRVWSASATWKSGRCCDRGMYSRRCPA